MNPLAEYAVATESIRRQLEELAREEQRHSRHPQIRRLGCEQRDRLLRPRQRPPRVVDAKNHAAVSQHVAILGAKILRRLNHRWFNFGGDDLLKWPGVDGACGYAASEADHHRRSGRGLRSQKYG